MMSKSTIIYCALSLLLATYLVVALRLTAADAADDRFRGRPLINVIDSARTGFVTEASLMRHTAELEYRIDTLRRRNFNMQQFENSLAALDVIEDVNVSMLNDGTLAIDVVPMVPVARVFTEGTSYYINASGKRITADRRHHIDVPVVTGHFSAERPPERLLPLLSKIAADPSLDALVSTVEQARNGDIILVPSIRGHVVVFGDTANAADKFERLGLFYRKVMPVKGWTFYDTVSVKFDGRVIASRRRGAVPELAVKVTTEEYDEFDEPSENPVPDEHAQGIDGPEPVFKTI